LGGRNREKNGAAGYVGLWEEERSFKKERKRVGWGHGMLLLPRRRFKVLEKLVSVLDLRAVSGDE